MKKSLVTLLVVTLLLPLYRPAAAQNPQDEEVVRVNSQEVKLDVVVKDKRGRPIKDLKETDFEVYEDGVRQQIRSFRFVSSEAGTVRGTGAKPGGSESAPAPSPSSTTP